MEIYFCFLLHDKKYYMLRESRYKNLLHILIFKQKFQLQFIWNSPQDLIFEYIILHKPYIFKAIILCWKKLFSFK